MSYTTLRQPQGKPTSICGFLREALIAEIVAINDYSSAIEYICIPEIRDLLHDIALDEKKHYGMFLEALRKYDSEEFDQCMRALKHVKIRDKPLKVHYPNDCKINTTTILNKIRENIKGEFEAILLYDYIVDEIDDDYIIDIFREIINEEIEHVEELTLALTRLDKDPYGPI